MLKGGVVALFFLVVYWTLVPERARRSLAVVVGVSVLAWRWPAAVAAVAGLSVATYLLLATLRGSARAVTPILLGLGILAIHKYAHLPAVPLVGLSYAVFKLVHVAIDVTSGRLALPSPGSFLEYALFAPAFVSGPIERYDTFTTGVDPSRLGLDNAFFGLRRILFGLAKKVFVVSPLALHTEALFHRFPQIGPTEAWRAILMFSLYVYLDFSAYCDLALGGARLLGYRLSENFAWPYLATNIAEFWRRWHITLSQWLRDYVFLPLSTGLPRLPALRRHPLVCGSLAALVTMLACGLWHGEGASFALWGLGHGALLAGHQAYRQEVLGRLPLRRRRALTGSLPYRLACGGLTFLSVTLLWVLFRWPPELAGQYFGLLLGNRVR